jgi:glycosyltransferase involved in cell wall biosynthesis
VQATPGAFAKACDEMLSDSTALKEMGERARLLALQRFDIDRVARQMLAQCEAILSQGKPLLDFQLTEV